MRNFYKIFELIFGSLLLLFDRSNGADAKDWGYSSGKSFKDPSQWKDIKGSSCGGKRQSPIDIKTENVQHWSALKPIKLFNLSSLDSISMIGKDSLSLKLDLLQKWKITFGEDGCLTPFTIHWHWGSNNSLGSEHTINNKRYPMEGHLASYDCNIYDSYKSAANSPSGLHVIGFLYEIGAHNKIIDLILDSQLWTLPSLKTDNITEIDLNNLLPKDLKKYYRYEGSLTSPDCNENVIWTLLNKTLTIGENQLSKLRTLQFDFPESGPMINNYRPIIQISENGDYIKRVVYSSFNISQCMKSNFLIIFLSSLMTMAKLISG